MTKAQLLVIKYKPSRKLYYSTRRYNNKLKKLQEPAYQFDFSE